MPLPLCWELHTRQQMAICRQCGISFSVRTRTSSTCWYVHAFFFQFCASLLTSHSPHFIPFALRVCTCLLRCCACIPTCVRVRVGNAQPVWYYVGSIMESNYVRCVRYFDRARGKSKSDAMCVCSCVRVCVRVCACVGLCACSVMRAFGCAWMCTCLDRILPFLPFLLSLMSLPSSSPLFSSFSYSSVLFSFCERASLSMLFSNLFSLPSWTYRQSLR